MNMVATIRGSIQKMPKQFKCTPLKIHMEPKNHPIAKRKSSSKLPGLDSIFIFQDVQFAQTSNKSSYDFIDLDVSLNDGLATQQTKRLFATFRRGSFSWWSVLFRSQFRFHGK